MKYLLKNNKTKEETICEKVKIDGFEYYISDEIPNKNMYFIHKTNADCSLHKCIDIPHLTNIFADNDVNYMSIYCKKVIATNNPNIDIPKIINEFENLAEQDADKCEYYKHPNSDNGYYDHVEGFKAGYNKAKETYHFTVQDMLDFGKYCINNQLCKEENRYYQYWELLQIFKEQQIKTIYYE